MLWWVIVVGLGILCGMLAIWTAHREKMAKIAKGLVLKEKPPVAPIGGLLISGLILLGIGAAVFIESFWA